jgi:hypothetical protein
MGYEVAMLTLGRMGLPKRLENQGRGDSDVMLPGWTA